MPAYVRWNLALSTALLVRRSVLNLLFVAAIVFSPSLHAALTVAVTDADVTVSGLTPGGSALLFNVSVTADQAASLVRNAAIVVTDTDNDGVVHYTPSYGVPLRSIWLAVDQQDGKLDSGGHYEYPVRDVDPHRTALKAQLDTGDPVYSFDTEADSLYIVIIRPGTASWKLLARDGGFGDADQTGNGSISVDVTAARRVDGTPGSPGSLQGGDVIVAVDPIHMDVMVQRIPVAAGGAQ